MKKLLFIFILLASAGVLFAQSSGFITANNDTLTVMLNIKNKNSDTKVLFRKLHEQIFHEIAPQNAEAAYVPGEWKYISFKIPSADKMVWAKCFFDGEYQLLKYQSEFYLVTPTETYQLEQAKQGSNINRFNGQMAAFFADKIDYDFNKLRYDANSLSEPLLLYHQQNGIAYTDYNKYTTRISTSQVGIGAGQTIGKLKLNTPAEYTINGYGGGIGFEQIFEFPDFSKKLAFSVGARFKADFFDYYTKDLLSGNTVFIDLNNSIISVGVLGSVYYHIVNTSGLKLSLQAGFDMMKPFAPDTEVRLETVTGNTVNTLTTSVATNDLALFSQFDQLLFCLPNLSEKWLLGLGASFPLNKPAQEQMVFSISRQYQAAIYYQF